MRQPAPSAGVPLKPFEWFIPAPQPPAPQVPPFGWMIPWGSSTVQRFQYPVQSTWVPTSNSIQPPPIGWNVQCLDPVRKRIYNEGFVSWNPTANPIQNPPYGWFVRWQDAVLRAPKPIDGAESWAPTAAPFQNPPIGWQVSWSTPVLPSCRVQDWIAWDPQVITAAVAALSFGWMIPWGSSTVQEWQFPSYATWVPTNKPIQNPPVGWFEAWGNQTISPHPTPDCFAWNPQPFVTVAAQQPFGWMIPWGSSSLREWQYPSYATWVPTSRSIQPSSIGWLLAWLDPTRNRVYNEGYIAWDAQPPPNLPVTPSQLGFYLAWDYTPRPARHFTDSWLAWTPTSAPIQNPPLGWFTKWLEPTISKKPTDGTAIWASTALPFQNPAIGWHQPFNVPVFPRLFVRDWIAWDPQVIFTVTVPPPIGWLLPWLDPVRRQRLATSDWFSWASTSAPFQNPPIGWYQPFNVPLILRRIVQDWIAWDAQKPPNLPVTPSQFGFYVPWGVPPIRTISGANGYYVLVMRPTGQVVTIFVPWIADDA